MVNAAAALALVTLSLTLVVPQQRYPNASAIGFATIPPTDEGGLSIAALNRMIESAVRGVKARAK